MLIITLLESKNQSIWCGIIELLKSLLPSWVGWPEGKDLACGLLCTSQLTHKIPFLLDSEPGQWKTVSYIKNNQ